LGAASASLDEGDAAGAAFAGAPDAFAVAAIADAPGAARTGAASPSRARRARELVRSRNAASP
jgi:hypothetical protein